MKKLLIALIVLLFLCFCCVVVLFMAFVAKPVYDIVQYEPTFQTDDGGEVDMEMVLLENETFLFVNKDKYNVKDIQDFNDRFEVISFTDLNGASKYSKVEVGELVEETDEYMKFGISNVNVYCLGVFEDKQPVAVSRGRLFMFLPAPSDAWMCEDLDIDQYPAEPIDF